MSQSRLEGLLRALDEAARQGAGDEVAGEHLSPRADLRRHCLHQRLGTHVETSSFGRRSAAVAGVARVAC